MRRENNSGSHCRIIFDPAGNPLRLRPADVLARGGEGVIYRFEKNPAYLIKLCRDDEKFAVFRERLAAMLVLRPSIDADFPAWPLMPVLSEGQEAVGFVMRRCSGRTLRALYAPALIRRFFPGWDRSSTAKVALNLVNAVQALARRRILVNDFNPDNFLIDELGVVRLIDCDSFQIPGKNGIFPGRAYTPEFAAPELLFYPELFDRERTPEQVRFSLAVVVYMILMSGLHPFARCGGADPVENLKSGKCPLDGKSGVRLPVGWHKSVSWLPESLREYFVTMFVDGYASPQKRPFLGELKIELERFIAIMSESKNKNQRAILPENAKRPSKRRLVK